MRLLLLYILLTAPSIIYAQGPCEYYSKYIEMGDAELKKESGANYEVAINAYSTALLHCPEKADSARARILKTFEAINSLKNSAEIARIKAEKASEVARHAQDQAEASAREAQNQRDTANMQRKLVQINRYNTLALNLALQTELEENYRDKVSLALRAYHLNKEYNNNVWNSAIVNAFWLSDSARYGQQLFAGNSAVLDFEYVEDKIIAITDRSELVSIKGLNQYELLSDDTLFYYRRNSLRYDIRDQVLEFYDQTGEIISYKKNDTEWLKAENRVALSPNLVPLNTDTLIINQSKVIRRQSGQPIILLNTGQAAATYSLSNDTTYLAVGTQDGWLYVYNLSTSKNQYEGPYHEAGSRISDIAFTDDNKFIGTSGLDGRVTINNIDSLGTKRPAEIPHNGWVNCIEFLPGNRFIVGTQNGMVIQYLFDQDELSNYACNSTNLPDTVPGIDNGPADARMKSECPKIDIDEKHSP